MRHETPPVLPWIGGAAFATALRVASAMIVATATAAAQTAPQAVPLDVTLRITDLENQPLAGIPVRLVLGSPWQAPDAGTRFMTDNQGEHRFTTMATLMPARTRRPTNFVSSLTRGTEPALGLHVAAEMPYMGFAWLYGTDIQRFESDGANLSQNTTIHARDARGHFTLPGSYDPKAGWSLPELQGLRLSRAGFELAECSLQPVADTSPVRWTLRLAWRKSPEAVRR